MNIRILSFLIIVAAFASGVFAQHDHAGHHPPQAPPAKVSTGVLLLAHGGKPGWNEEVNKVAAEVRKQYPTEVAFGMATKRTIQEAVDKLNAQKVTQIVAVPLFISSNSSVISSTEFLLGLRKDAHPDLARFAKMDHGHGGKHDSHSGHTAEKGIDPLTPVISAVPIRSVPALDAHPLVADILLSRAEALSKDQSAEVLVIVAHGPVSDETNKLWLADMKTLAGEVAAKSSFARIEYLTVRDDAPEPIRSAATAEFRSIVKKAVDENRRVLIVPLLLSFGGIEEGVKKRLEGLPYAMSDQALLPDERLTQWVLRSVESVK